MALKCNIAEKYGEDSVTERPATDSKRSISSKLKS